MMDSIQATKLVASVAKIEEGIKYLRHEIQDLKGVTVTRLNNHTDQIDSLEQTRDKRRGATHLAIVLIGVLGSLSTYLAFFR